MSLNAVQNIIQSNIPKDCINFIENVPKGSGIQVPFARNESNEIIEEDMSRISHMLIAGTTGTGKTVFIQSLITFMAIGYEPEQIRFILIDSKGYEYSSFNMLPHLYLPVVTDLNKVKKIFDWVESEIKDRLANRESSCEIFIIIDDYASLTMDSYYDIDQLVRILQTGRSVGIHFWICTSIPTSKIISTELKLNIPYRVAFDVTSKSISRMIIDDIGAENLNVPGRIIYKGLNRDTVGNVIYLEENKIDEIIKNMGLMYPFSEGITVQESITSIHQRDDESGYDELIAEAGRWIIQRQKASIGMLQRIFKLGFNRCARIMDQLEELGVVGLEEGTKPRSVLMDLNQFEELVKKINYGDIAKIKDEQGAETRSSVDEKKLDVKSGLAGQMKENVAVAKAFSEQTVMGKVQESAAKAFLHVQKQEKEALDKLGDIAVEAFSHAVIVNEESEILFTPKPKIDGKDAGLEICDDHIEITKRLNWMQVATYSFAPRKINRVIYRSPSIATTGYVKFELDSFKWEITDNSTANTYTKQMPEQVFIVKFDRNARKEFEAYARQIATEGGIDFVIE